MSDVQRPCSSSYPDIYLVIAGQRMLDKTDTHPVSDSHSLHFYGFDQIWSMTVLDKKTDRINTA